MNKSLVVAIATWSMLIAVGLILFSTSQLSAQDDATATATATVPPTPTPAPTPTAFPLQKMTFNLMANADLELVTDGPSAVRVATISMAPGVVSLPFTTEGPTTMVLQAGTIVVTSDNAVVTVTDIGFAVGIEPVASPSGPINELSVVLGEQIYLSPNSTTTIRNDSAGYASVLIVAVVPIADATPSP